jgi:predicted transglutaminase-like cysteine proteinase
MRKIWLIYGVLPFLFSCGSKETAQTREMQEAVRLFEASHHLYDSLSQVRSEISQSQLVAQDSLSRVSWQAWQSELDQWHEDMVTAGAHSHDGSHHDHDHAHHHEPEVQLTDQQMLDIQEEQWQTIQRLAEQLESFR